MLVDTTFIYFLKDPENPNKGYVGKTDRPRKRLSEHVKESGIKRHYRANWIKSLVARGLAPTLEIVDEVPFQHWKQLEAAYIEFFLESGFELVNGTFGGDGMSNPTPATLKKMSEAQCGEKSHQFGKTGALSHMFGRKLPLEVRKKISDGVSGEKHPQFGKTGALSPNFGRKNDAATLAKMRKKRPGSSSNFHGVYQVKNRRKKWAVKICVQCEYINLGRFLGEIEAAKAYDVAAKKYHGAHAVLNFPD